MSLATVISNIALDTLVKYQGLTYAKIIKYDSALYVADVQILKFRKSRGESEIENVDYPKAYNIPIILLGGTTFSIRPDYKKGDIVILAHSVSEIDTTGEKSSDTSKLLSKDNCVIIGSVGEAGEDNAIVITDEETTIKKGDNEISITDNEISAVMGTTEMSMKAAEILFTVGTTTFKIDATGATVSVGGLTVNLFTHMHPTAAPGPPSPPTPGT